MGWAGSWLVYESMVWSPPSIGHGHVDKWGPVAQLVEHCGRRVEGLSRCAEASTFESWRGCKYVGIDM